jgi:PEP-CTERM motif
MFMPKDTPKRNKTMTLWVLGLVDEVRMHFASFLLARLNPQNKAFRRLIVRHIPRLAIFVILAAATLAAHADSITFVLTQPIQSGTPGSVIDYSATVTAPVSNVGNVFLNGDSFVTDVGTLNDSPFFANFPLFLAPGGSFTGVIFAIDIPGGTAPGPYPGSYTLLGDPNGGSSGFLGTVLFQTNVVSPVTTTPEPSTFALLGTGILGLAGAVRRKVLSYS